MKKIASLADNAILAKSRAMTNDILKSEDYSALIGCRNLSEAVSYLKNRTAYSNALSTASGMGLYRSRIEADIRKFNIEKITKLASFESAIGQKMHEIIYLNFDVDLILNCANHLDTNIVSDFSLFTPKAYFKTRRIDPIALERASSFDEFYDALSGTRFQKPLDIFKNGNAVFTITSLENALYQYLCGETKRIIKENFDGNDEEKLLEIFKMKYDFKMIESIYRMKKYFPDEALDFSNIFYTGLSAFTPKQTLSLINSKNAGEFFKILQKSAYGKFFEEQYRDRIETFTRTALFKTNQKNLRFSVIPEVVMFSFIGLLENETRNLIHIIECVNYGLAPEETAKFLIYNTN